MKLYYDGQFSFTPQQITVNFLCRTKTGLMSVSLASVAINLLHAAVSCIIIGCLNSLIMACKKKQKEVIPTSLWNEANFQKLINYYQISQSINSMTTQIRIRLKAYSLICVVIFINFQLVLLKSIKKWHLFYRFLFLFFSTIEKHSQEYFFKYLYFVVRKYLKKYLYIFLVQ